MGCNGSLPAAPVYTLHLQPAEIVPDCTLFIAWLVVLARCDLRWWSGNGPYGKLGCPGLPAMGKVCTLQNFARGVPARKAPQASLLSWLIIYNRFFAAAHFVQNDVGRGLPDECLGLFVPSREPCVNRPLQFVG